jgi:hypothetical protein
MNDSLKGSLIYAIKFFLENSNDDGTLKYSSDKVLFIMCLFKIWSIFHSLLNVEQSTFEFPSTGLTPDKKMEIFYLKACGNNAPDQDQLNKLKTTVLSKEKLIELIPRVLGENKDGAVKLTLIPYDETIRNFFVEWFETKYKNTLHDLKASDKLIEDIIGFKKTSSIGQGYIKIHSGVGFFLPGRNKYCEELIERICDDLDMMGIRYMVSDTVKDKCFKGLTTYSDYHQWKKKQPQGGGRSSRRRKAYKTTRRNNKNKKQYRRKRHTKRCNKSHRRSRR